MASVDVDNRSGFHVLVVDDMRDSADMLSELIRLELPYTVSTAYDGGQAVRMALALRPQVVILDLSMPGLNGIEAAQQIDIALADQAPLLVVMTGKDGVETDLADIDSAFDHAFAKPPDLPRLMSLLTTEANRRQGRPEPAKSFDFAELFTRAARQIVPLTLARDQLFAFDCRGPTLLVEGDAVEFYRCLHRLLHAAVDILQSGFVMFAADIRGGDPDQPDAPGDGRCSLAVTAAGIGPLARQEDIAAVQQRLQLTEEAPRPGGPNSLRIANGVCPNTEAAIKLSTQAGEGFLLRVRWQRRVADGGTEPTPCSADGAMAWVIDLSGCEAAWLSRRLQRLGWTVRQLKSCNEAALRLLQPLPADEAPALVVVIEQRPPSPTSAAGKALLALRAQLVPSTPLVLASMARPDTLRDAAELPGLDLRAHPLSPADLLAFTRKLPRRALRNGSAAADLPSAETSHRRRVLVADDNAVNRIIMRAMLESLGYEVATASDGLDAIEQCRHAPPDVVLMDLDMQVLGGLEATRRLRELQRDGHIAPFSIVACTSHTDQRQRCAAMGMDGYLVKPLSPALLRTELQRINF